MKHLPPNYTEAQVLEIINRVVSRLSSKFRFGYHDIEDIEQEGRIFAMEALEKYIPPAPLENFLYVVLSNKYSNYQRKHLRRRESPCQGCPFFDPDCKQSTNKCAVFEDKMECSKYNGWETRNNSKANIMEPADITNIRDEHEKSMRRESDVFDNVCMREITDKIDRNLPVSLRSDYLKMRNNVRIPSHRKAKVEEACRRIIGEDLDA